MAKYLGNRPLLTVRNKLEITKKTKTNPAKIICRGAVVETDLQRCFNFYIVKKCNSPVNERVFSSVAFSDSSTLHFIIRTSLESFEFDYDFRIGTVFNDQYLQYKTSL